TTFDGKFTIGALAAGAYAVTAVREGYAASRRQIDVPAAGPVTFMLAPASFDRARISMADMERALPESPYKAQLIACQICHSWNGLAAQRPHRTQDWISGMRLMNKIGFAQIPEADIPKMAEYLQA